jgi:hypothetical protein
MDNFTLGFNEIEPIRPIYIYSQCSLSEWGIFISSILLSGGAFIAQILSQIQKSKCKNITCLGSSCIREVET